MICGCCCSFVVSCLPVSAEAREHRRQDGEAEGDVADGDDDEGEHVGRVVAVRRIRPRDERGVRAVDINAACKKIFLLPSVRREVKGLLELLLCMYV